MNDAERRLWSRLRAHRMDGRKFRRQHAIGSYIVDFVCLPSRLIIEVDGDSHGNDLREALDSKRTAYLEKLGFRVLRFWNEYVLTDIDNVTETIFEALNANSRPAPQPSPLRGEGALRSDLSGDFMGDEVEYLQSRDHAEDPDNST